MPESQRHKRMCDLMYDILVQAVTPEHAVASDCFVYFDASNKKRCLAPDAFAKLDFPHTPTSPKAWEVWENGTPELAIEILSPSDTKEPLTWPEKIERYHALGIRELVSFDADEIPGARVRAWDRIDGDLVERVVVGETTCTTLSALLGRPIDYVLAPGFEVSLGLRLADSGILLPTPLEAERTAKEAERTAKEAERTAKEEALRENAALRAEIERLKRGPS